MNLTFKAFRKSSVFHQSTW
uniref:Uncharacterized protein n=1 Tax=Anguilla anguilla TaxID=7936 RepID=A0A0E9Y0M9_ANGAN